MGMIRQADAHLLARDAVVLDLGDLARQGEAILARARSQASRIIEEARREREAILAGAEEQGRAKGEQAGFEHGRTRGLDEGRASAHAAHAAELAVLSEQWRAALEVFESQREGLLEEARRDLLRVSLDLATRIVRRRTEGDPRAAQECVEEVLALVSRPTRLVVRVNPDDAPGVNEALPGLLARFAMCAHVEIREDPMLARGSCAAQTERGGVFDASITERLERAARAMLGEGA